MCEDKFGIKESRMNTEQFNLLNSIKYINVSSWLMKILELFDVVQDSILCSCCVVFNSSLVKRQLKLMCFRIPSMQLPALQDDGPASDNYGRFSSRDRGGRGGRGSRGSRSWGGRSSDDDDDDGFRRGGRSYKTENSWSRNSRSSDDDWLIGNRRSNRPSSFGNKDRYSLFL